MADLVSEIMGMATPAVVNALASSFGLSGGAVSSVLSGAVPGILGALVNRGSTPSGGKAILAQMAGVNPSVMSGLASALGGGGAGAMASQGTSMLTALLGRDGVSSLTNAVLGNAGVSAASGGPLMGLAAQMVMGGLGKSAGGMDGAGLSNLLVSQKGAIQAALPAGIGSVLGMAGGLASGMSSGMSSGIAGAGAAASSMASSAASRASSTMSGAASQMGNAASQVQASMPSAPSAGGMGWLRYALPIALIALAAWWFMGRKDSDDMAKMASKPAATATATATAPTAIMVGDVDVGKSLTGAMGNLTGALGGVTDAASAKAALPKLTEAGTAIASVSALASKFSPEQKTAVAGMVNAGLPALSGLATKVQGNAEVVGVLKPVLDGILSNLTALTK